MRIFPTGATGYIGAAVLDALVRGGHDVTALVRDNEKARQVAKRGAHPVVGNLADPESFRTSADAQDGYVHAAYDAPSVRHGPIDEARHKVGVYGEAMALDQVIRSPRSRALGWTPTPQSVAGNAARLLEEWRESNLNSMV
jgi:uncharacterized protein YbjT (DUF2867 family)